MNHVDWRASTIDKQNLPWFLLLFLNLNENDKQFLFVHCIRHKWNGFHLYTEKKEKKNLNAIIILTNNTANALSETL